MALWLLNSLSNQRVFGHSGAVKLLLVCNDHIVRRNIHNNDITYILIHVGV